MKILFSHKLMGIVVSSSQTCNISWHGVTRLNAICVLISSLGHLWPPENRDVRWFSFFHSLSWLPGCACLLICTTVICVSLPAPLVWPDFQGGFSPARRGCIHLVSWQRQTCSHTTGSATCTSTRFCPGALRLRCTTCQPAVFLEEGVRLW